MSDFTGWKDMTTDGSEWLYEKPFITGPIEWAIIVHHNSYPSLLPRDTEDFPRWEFAADGVYDSGLTALTFRRKYSTREAAMTFGIIALVFLGTALDGTPFNDDAMGTINPHNPQWEACDANADEGWLARSNAEVLEWGKRHVERRRQDIRDGLFPNVEGLSL